MEPVIKRFRTTKQGLYTLSRQDALFIARPQQFRFLHLLRLEEAEETAALRYRLSTWGIQRLEREGYCMTGLHAYWLEENQFGKPVASLSLGPGVILPDSKLEYVLS